MRWRKGKREREKNIERDRERNREGEIDRERDGDIKRERERERDGEIKSVSMWMREEKGGGIRFLEY